METFFKRMRMWAMLMLVVLGLPACGAGTTASPTLGNNENAHVLAPPVAKGSYWAKTYEGLATDYGRSIAISVDNGYVVSGNLSGSNAAIKLDNQGVITWQKQYNGSEESSVAIQTTDGGYVILGQIPYTDNTGYVSSEPYVAKLDNSDGTVSWQKRYLLAGGNASNKQRQIMQTADGGYLLMMRHFPVDSFSTIILLKIASDGIVTWSNEYVVSGEHLSADSDILPTSDGGYIVVLMAYGGSLVNSSVVLKIGGDGTLAWSKSYSNGYNNFGESIAKTSDGGFVIVGGTRDSGNKEYAFAIKLTADGAISWQKQYGDGTGNYFNWIRQTADGGYIAAGSDYGSGTGFWVVKLAGNGHVTWQKMYGGGEVYTVEPTADGGYVASGSGSFGGGWVVKLRSDGTCPPLDIDTSDSVRNGAFFDSVYPVTSSPITAVMDVASLTSVDTNITVTQQAPLP